MRNKCTLRVKMALWFTVSILMITALFFSVLYLTTRSKLNAMLRDDLTLALQQLSSQVEHEHGQLIFFEDETPVKSGIMYYIMEENGSELASFGEDIALFDVFPICEGKFTNANVDGEDWLLLDSDLLNVDGESVRIRVVISCQQKEQMLRIFKIIFALGVPVMALLSALIGVWIAKRSLSPIQNIITCAHQIAEGDFSKRVEEVPTKDELGDLSKTLNRMLTGLENSFRREQRFTSDASHELRTPVAVILAYAESLHENAQLSEEDRAKVEPILGECRRIQRMIEQMLTLTRAQEGRYPVTMEKISLSDVLEGVQTVIEPIAAQKKIAVHFECNGNIELTADQSLITQMLLNLTENAVKYGRTGGDIQVYIQRQEDDAQIIVSDNGIGISKENLPHIFDRFFRADTARDRSGTGLGLSIVQWIVALHDGNIQAESTLSVGTKFIITLPIKI